MSKLGCRCGNIISDVHYPSPTEGLILREQEHESYEDGVGEDIAAFIRAVVAGNRTAWIVSHFGPDHPTTQSDADVVGDILSRRDLGLFLGVSECDRCGRLWVQRKPCVNEWLSFAPDEPGYVSLLRARPAVDA